MSIGGHEPRSSTMNEWHTPQYILDDLGPFEDNPALPGMTDGLLRKWVGFTWMNPPYSEIETWMTKLADHGNGIALVFARTETKWFQRTVWERADALRFIYQRIAFLKNGNPAKGNSGAPSVLVAYGAEAVSRLERCKLPGVVVKGWQA